MEILTEIVSVDIVLVFFFFFFLLQKLGCMAIRNMVARVPENQKHFMELGVENVITQAAEQHGEVMKDVAQAALRDLGINVKLQEQWRGTGHEIHR